MLFVDNNPALCSLVKGYSPAVDASELIGQFWIDIASLGVGLFVDRVESGSNLADGPSRRDLALLEKLGSRQVELDMTWCSRAGDKEDVSTWFQAPPLV